LRSQIDIINESYPKWGVLGLFGVTRSGTRVGHIIDLHGHLMFGPLPQEVQTLDELCLIIRRDSGLVFDESLDGFHFYGADLCLEAADRGFSNLAIDACVKHLGKGKMGEDFWRTAANFARKWKQREAPAKVVKTTCAIVRVQRGAKACVCSASLRLRSRIRHVLKRVFPSDGERYSHLCDDIDIESVCPLDQYYEWFRKEVYDAIPGSARRVLSVGCAGGLTEAQLVKRGIDVIGVEMNHEAAELARHRGLTVLEGDAATMDVTMDGCLYDCLVYADVLEHLVDPVAVLKRHVKSLAVGGIVFVSIPNFRHYSVFWELFLRGRVHYRDAGILDRTHLRMTTRKMVQQWFREAGIESVRYKYINNRRRAKLIAALFLGLAQEFTAVQIGVIGKKVE